MSDNPTVTFKVPIEIPRRELDRLRAWLNTEHTGAPDVMPGQTVSAALLQAHLRLIMTEQVALTVEVDRDGRWILVNNCQPPTVTVPETT